MLLNLLGLQKLLDNLFDEHWCTLWTPEPAPFPQETWLPGLEE